MHQAVHGERRFPAERLVDAVRRAVDVEQQILGRGREAERQSVQRMHRPDLRGGLGGRRRGLRERRLVAEAARAIDRAQQHLQQMDGAAGLEAVGMRADAAHRMHGDRPADDLVVIAAGPIDPADWDLDRVVERRLRQFRRDAPDGRGAECRIARPPSPARSSRRDSAPPSARTPDAPCAHRLSVTSPTRRGAMSAASAL